MIVVNDAAFSKTHTSGQRRMSRAYLNKQKYKKPECINMPCVNTAWQSVLLLSATTKTITNRLKYI